MEIRCVQTERERYLPLLLLGDEQENMILRYLYRGKMTALWQKEQVIGVSVVTQEEERLWELKNIAVLPEYQAMGYGRRLLEDWCRRLEGQGVLQAGTGETPKTMGFYIACGFQFSHRITDFFIHHYDHQIVEDGIVLNDMVYFSRKL